MTTINLNGQQQRFDAARTVTDLVSHVTGRQIGPGGTAGDGQRLGVAVARNAEVVPRSQWSSTVLLDGDDVEIVTAVQGG